jgi:chromosome segregation protein
MSAATAAAGSEMERLEGRQAGLVGEIAALAAEEERLAGEQPAAEGARTQAERYLQAVGAAGPPLEEAVETARDGLVEALNEEARARNLVEALSRRREDLSGRRQKLTDEQGTLGERLVANGRAIEAADLALRRLDDERDTLVHAREGAARERGEVAASQRVQSDRLLALQAEVTELRSRAASLRTLHERHEGCALGATRLLGRKDPNAVLLASVLRVPEELERAVAAALGTRLAHVVVADTTGALDAVRWLWQTDGGRATVLPRDSGRRRPTIVPTGRRLVDLIEVDTGHWALAEALLGDVVLADDLEAALDVWHRAPHAVTAVTRRGEAIDALGAVSGGSDPPIEETMLARARELRELEDGVAALSAHVAAAERALAETADRLRQSAERVEVLDRRAQEIRVERVGADKDREGLEAERERIKAALEVAALEASGLAGEDGQMADELCVLRERLVRLQDAVGGRRAALSECQRRLARWHEEQRAAEGAHTAAAVHAAAVVERLRAARAELERCRTTLGENQDRLAVVRRQESETSVAAQEALREAGMAAATAADAEREAEALEQERTTILVAIAEADALLTRDDTTERTVSERLEAAREERSRFEVASAEHRMHLDNLATQLTERYGLEPSTLDGVAVEEDGADEERAARADALRGRLARLGDVNPTAIEELDELRSRHEFLSAQRDDLERSLEDLRRTIAKLVRTSRERFAQTFTAVNEKLAEVFPKLFPGGRARLELRELEDAEEPGVEIVVQPAGKKLQTLSLLSGGEKALTAVTLILALFLTRPTPFCLLDEVDAPLDEANIGRFNQVIRELSTRSQFVLITHNRRTMEAADTLYGITMEQAGVSKVVSVRLRDAA